MIRELIHYGLIAFSSLFAIVDPLGNTSVFMTLTANNSLERKINIAKRASLTSFLVMMLFAVAGRLIFQVFGITIGAFQIAGGIILFRISMNMLAARKSRETQTDEEIEDAVDKEDVAIIPLAIPMMSGPGAITTVIMLMGRAWSIWHILVLFCCISAVCFTAYLILRISSRIVKFMGRTGLNTMTRVMGLLLAVISVQFVINGIKSTIPEIMDAMQGLQG